MLELVIPENELYIPASNRFVTVPGQTLTLEHSLMSIAKWESRWHVPYLSTTKRTPEQELDYIRCMSIKPIKNEYVLSMLTPEHLAQLRAYIDDPMTATTFSKRQRPTTKKIVTAELLYYRMFDNNIPMECQKWHLNSLLTLIQVCDEKNAPAQKTNKRQTAMRYADQNAQRRAKHNTRG